MKITIIYDNWEYDSRLKTDHGFSCLIEYNDKRILFDTGAKPEIFQDNLKELKIDINQFDLVFLSHFHLDHTGGFPVIYEKRKDLPVYIPISFRQKFSERFSEYPLEKIIPVSEKIEILPGVFSTGEAGEKVREHSMVISTAKGLVLITGCAHQGIIEILEGITKDSKENIYMVLGGFHFKDMSLGDIENRLKLLKEIRIKHPAPCHCTGNTGILKFYENYGSSLIRTGVGRVIEV
ncbi:MAG: MBL fold metallo-hydrolase [bacterium]|nr:MBL fold metallo-hydrolase [bacterium]